VLKGRSDEVQGVVFVVTTSSDGLLPHTRTRTHPSLLVTACNHLYPPCDSLQVLKGHSEQVEGVVFDVAISSDGSLAALVSNDFCCRVYDLDEDTEEREPLQVLKGHSGW
jgi:WD40 repeat protein